MRELEARKTHPQMLFAPNLVFFFSFHILEDKEKEVVDHALFTIKSQTGSYKTCE